MDNNFIPCNDLGRGYRLYAKEYNDRAIEVLESGWYVLGKQVTSYEEEYAKSLGGDCYVAGVDNGLNAIRLGLYASGIGPGDEVIVQANGYIATMLGVTQNGGVPVFVDSDKYHHLDPSKVEAAITEKTKAVLVTNLYGQTTLMEPFLEICKKHDLMLFEDCAQSHYSVHNGVQSGLFGKAGFFSFYPTKNVGGFGDGGAIVSKDKDFIDRIKTLRNYGSDRKYHNVELGFNSRLDELQAGLLRVKLSHIQELIGNRRKYAKAYLEGMHNPKVVLPEIVPGTDPVWYLFVVNVEDQAGFRKYLESKNIGSDIHFPTPPYLQPALEYLGYREGSFPVAEKDCKTVVSLPMMDHMEDEEVDRVIKAVNEYEG